MTREEAFKEINKTQEFYIDKLITELLNKDNDCFKTINFTSPTGTGKTNMMSLLCNKMSDYYFVITTLSKGQLHIQIRTNMKKLVKQDNFMVYGLCDYTSNTKRTAQDIISLLPTDKKIIWLRDEGHINTNKWQEILNARCFKIVNFSATNKEDSGIKCNFTNTMMLRTVSQNIGTPEDALDKLLEVKEQHKNVIGYNPCAIMRCLDSNIEQRVIEACIERNLKYINITTEDFDMSDLCKDDNEYDVILNRFKIVEGIDIRRAHVLYMTNEPSNIATTIQVIGRCRRNALLYRNDIDIFSNDNEELLNNTRQCFVFYNVENMNIAQDNDGELCQAFCDHISCQELKPNSTIEVVDGKLPNGLTIIELQGETGTFTVDVDKETGFNVINPEGEFYSLKKTDLNEDNSICKTFKHSYTDYYNHDANFKKFKLLNKRIYTCENILFEKEFILNHFGKYERKSFNYSTGEEEIVGYDYKPWKENSVTLYLTEEQINSLNEEVKLIKTKYNESIEKFIDYLKYVQTSKSLLDSHILPHGRYYIIKHLPSLPYGFNTLNINFDYLNVLKFIKTNDIKCFIMNKKDIGLNPLNSLCWDTTYTEHKFSQIENARGYLKSEINKLIYSISASSFFKNVSIYKKSRLRGDYISHISYTFTQGIHLNMVNGEYDAITVDKEILKKFSWNIQDRTLDNLIIHDYELEEKYYHYTKTINDRESAIVGTDLMKRVKDSDVGDTFWVEDRAVTGKVSKYSKFNTFISNKYADKIEEAKPKLFNGKNNFKFDSKCNSCLGYCVEYYSKYLVYGDLYLGKFLEDAKEESKCTELNDYLIVRACMLKYRDNMVRTYGENVAKVIQTISAQSLIQSKYKEFVKTVIELGQKTAEFVKEKMNITKKLSVGDKIHDPNLTIKHIAGLADYIDENTIIDIKTTNSITMPYIKQVLSYHYLSTKRSDLHINKVIVFDSVSGKSVEINI